LLGFGIGDMRATLLLLSLCLTACGTGEVGLELTPDSGLPVKPVTVTESSPDAGNPGRTLVFAHTDADLYRIDPDKLTVTKVGSFSWPASVSGEQMTDIAIDRTGQIVGLSFYNIYSVDPRTAVCTLLAPLTGEFNGLTFISNAGGPEDLVAASREPDAIYRLDAHAGTVKLIGSYGTGLTSSGDLVSVRNVGTLATVVKPGSDTDWLAKVDPARGVATAIGDTGYSKIYGLGFWRNRVYGFSEGGDFLLIDPGTGKATAVAQSGVKWWGAAVTTDAVVDL
jgi:hypothetical protein